MDNLLIPTHVGPSKLDLLLADAPDLSDESKEKVIIIIDIIRLYKLMRVRVTPKGFYTYYDLNLRDLSQVQHDVTVMYNTWNYQHANNITGADF